MRNGRLPEKSGVPRKRKGGGVEKKATKGKGGGISLNTYSGRESLGHRWDCEDRKPYRVNLEAGAKGRLPGQNGWPQKPIRKIG